MWGQAESSRDPTLLSVAESSRDRVALVEQLNLPQCEVPLLSQEGLTCRLLPGAAAPWSPALYPVLECRLTAPRT